MDKFHMFEFYFSKVDKETKNEWLIGNNQNINKIFHIFRFESLSHFLTPLKLLV